MILIEHPETGDRCLVESSAGYPGWVIVGEAIEAPAHDHFRWDEGTEAFVEDFAELDTALLAKIDREAGAFRSRFITAIPGQETTYRLKEEEALAWNEGVSDPADFPYLREEATAKGIAIATLVTVVLTTAAQWRALNPKIEAARTASKDEVLAAGTVAAKEAAATVDWGALL